MTTLNPNPSNTGVKCCCIIGLGLLGGAVAGVVDYLENNALDSASIGWILLGVVLGLLAGSLMAYCCCKNNKENDQEAGCCLLNC